MIVLFRVGQAITPPNALMCPTTNSTMPTAAAVAAAAATAKIQALDAVASNAVMAVPQITQATVTKVPSLPAPHPTAALHPQTLSPLQTIPQVTPVVTTITIPVAPPVVLQPPQIIAPIVLGSVPALPTPALAVEDALKKAHEIRQEELQKILLEENDAQTLQQQETMSIKGQNARQLVMQRLMRPQESKVVILRNMVGIEDVDETLQDEIQDECSKFGVVERVIIYNEKQTENEDDEDAEVIVKIFVEFSASSECTKATDALHGRFFGGRRVVAQSYDQALFDHGDLSG